MAVVSAGGVLRRLNAAGRDILGASCTDGRSPFLIEVCDVPDGDSERMVEWPLSEGQTANLDYRFRVVGQEILVCFRDVTAQRRQQRRVAAVAATAAGVASERSLAVSLGAMAQEIALTDGLAGVQIIAANPRRGSGLQIMGSAGFAHSDNFFDLLIQCRNRGASLRMLDALSSGRPVVVRHRYADVMRDPAWLPLREYLRSPAWDDFASVPLLAHDRPLGVLNAFFSPGQAVGDDVLEFFATMADQAALALDYAELLEQQRVDAGRAERQRLARDLHDSVVQQVFSIGMQTEALKVLSARSGDADWARVAAVASELEASTRDALHDLRSLVTQLHPATPIASGLTQALSELVSTVMRRSPINVTLICTAAVDVLPEGLAEDFYFIVAEALHNVVKHAHASSVTIRVSRDPLSGEVVADVSDDGIGIVVGGVGYGLTSMRSRAELWHGSFAVEPSGEGGTRVRVTIPLASISPVIETRP